VKSLICCAVVLAAVVSIPRVHAENIAARVNGVPITETQVREFADRLPRPDDATADTPDARRQEALQSLIDNQVLIQQAKAENIEASPEEVEQQFVEIKGRYQTAEAFQQALEANHATEAALRAEIVEGLVTQKLVDRHVSVTLPPDAAARYYKEHSSDFEHPAAVRVSHIFFHAPAGTDMKRLQQRAKQVLARLRKGEDFDKLAKELSEDTRTASRGGDLGYVARDDVVKPFADAAFKLKPGQVGGPVQTEFGLHIIKVTEKRQAGLAPLADLKEEIEGALEEEERDNAEHAYLDDLKKKAKIEIVEQQKAASQTSGAP
jgi:peptidyl-prolyl cis-trans isomerase C